MSWSFQGTGGASAAAPKACDFPSPPSSTSVRPPCLLFCLLSPIHPAAQGSPFQHTSDHLTPLPKIPRSWHHAQSNSREHHDHIEDLLRPRPHLSWPPHCLLLHTSCSPHCYLYYWGPVFPLENRTPTGAGLSVFLPALSSMRGIEETLLSVSQSMGPMNGIKERIRLKRLSRGCRARHQVALRDLLCFDCLDTNWPFPHLAGKKN